MNMGLDFSEIAVILVLILLFFGSKEIPNILRQTARFLAKVRVYSDKVRREIDEIARIDEPMPNYDQEVIVKKNAIREKYLAVRKEMPQKDRDDKTAAIWGHLGNDDAYRNARSVMMYVELGSEVATREEIRKLIAAGKRVVIPYMNEDASMGIGEITNLDTDIELGSNNIMVPVKEKRNNFFKSDIQVIITPGVAFDIYGARLGRGKGAYDRFLKDMKGRIPIYAIAFDCQIMPETERLPFAYHDIIVDQIITESGMRLKKATDPLTPAGTPYTAG